MLYFAQLTPVLVSVAQGPPSHWYECPLIPAVPAGDGISSRCSLLRVVSFDVGRVKPLVQCTKRRQCITLRLLHLYTVHISDQVPLATEVFKNGCVILVKHNGLMGMVSVIGNVMGLWTDGEVFKKLTLPFLFVPCMRVLPLCMLRVNIALFKSNLVMLCVLVLRLTSSGQSQLAVFYSPSTHQLPL